MGACFFFFFLAVNVLIFPPSAGFGPASLHCSGFLKNLSVDFCFYSFGLCVCVAADKAFSPHSEAKKQALGPDDLRTSSMGRPVLSPYPIPLRDMAKISHEQHMLHLNCESRPCEIAETRLSFCEEMCRRRPATDAYIANRWRIASSA